MYICLDFSWTHGTLLFVTQPDYKRTLEQAQAEFQILHSEKERLKKRIADIDRHMSEVAIGIKGLARLCDQKVTKELLSGDGLPLLKETSLNEAVRFALQTSKSAMSPVEVREALRSLGFNLDKYKTDFLATLHTVLKRLHARREVDVEALPDGKKGYKWITEADKAEELIVGLSEN